jgi:hypothetical protein
VPNTPSADFCRPVRTDCPALSRDSTTNGRSPEVSSTAFRTQPPNLQPVPLMDMDFAVIGQLVRHRMPHIRFLFIGPYVCSTLLSVFRPRLATTPLRFAITSTPSGCEKDFHLQAVEHARHTQKRREASSKKKPPAPDQPTTEGLPEVSGHRIVGVHGQRTGCRGACAGSAPANPGLTRHRCCRQRDNRTRCIAGGCR